MCDGTPLSSIRRLPAIETLVSCRAAPAPRATCPVEWTVCAISRPAAAASNGVSMSGSVTVSVSGTPRRSVRKTIRCPMSETSRQESSSSESWRMRSCRSTPSSGTRNGIEPPRPTIVVRWNPVGIDPSRYCLRITWSSETRFTLNSSATSIARRTASSSIGNGGVSSIS